MRSASCAPLFGFRHALQESEQSQFIGLVTSSTNIYANDKTKGERRQEQKWYQMNVPIDELSDLRPVRMKG